MQKGNPGVKGLREVETSYIRMPKEVFPRKYSLKSEENEKESHA